MVEECWTTSTPSSSTSASRWVWRGKKVLSYKITGRERRLLWSSAADWDHWEESGSNTNPLHPGRCLSSHRRHRTSHQEGKSLKPGIFLTLENAAHSFYFHASQCNKHGDQRRRPVQPAGWMLAVDERVERRVTQNKRFLSSCKLCDLHHNHVFKAESFIQFLKLFFIKHLTAS